MQLVVWNSQGGKWDTLWTYYIAPLIAGGEDVIGLTVEGGWAPWVTPGDVYVNSVYSRDTSASWFDAQADARSAFCQGVGAARRRFAAWVPWIKNFNAMKVNTRCSLGAVMIPQTRALSAFGRFLPEDPTLLLRPIFRFQLDKAGGGRGGTPDFSVFLVHLISGYPNRARQQMSELVADMARLIPQGSGAVIVGDFNINILGQAAPFDLPNGWRLLRTGVATQQAGGELDYALLFDPALQYGAAAAVVVQQFKTGNNPSDHSVLRYGIPLN